MQLTYSVFVHIESIESSATSSAAIAAIFIQCFPQKTRSYAEAVGETTNGFTYSIEGAKVNITDDKETVTSLTLHAAVGGQADKR